MKNNKLIYGAIGVVALLAIGGGLMVAVKRPTRELRSLQLILFRMYQ